ncbi:MAG: hypothetical protein HUJ56_03670 [Erysipelotrichaceae bacterium]|nr:hypothetical protein [Erysipelotrichaceae bacterium]
MSETLNLISKYLLLAAIFMFVVVLFFTVSKALNLVSEINAYKGDFDKIKTNVEDVTTRGTKLAETIKSVTDTTAKVLPLLLLAKAVKKAYDDEEENGVKGVKKSVNTVMMKRSEKEAVKKQWNKVLKK